MFVLVIPGHPMLTQFNQISETQWSVDIPSPARVNMLTFSLTNPLPDNCAAALSWSAPPFSDIEFIGAIANERPSDTFHISWSFNPQISTSSLVKLLISLESIPSITELIQNKQSTDVRQVYAKKVALNLFRFMESFNRNTDMHQGVLVLPVDVLDKWLLRFEHKFKLDPFFVLNTE